jgi:hypothetical protein
MAALDYEGKLLMPKATGVWLIENTMLTFKQIAEFIEITEIEVEALANEEIGRGIVGRNPIEHNELTKEEITKCEADPHTPLGLKKRSDLPKIKVRAKGPRYTPVSKRGDKPDAIAFIVKNFPDITDAQICKLVGTTKPTILAIRERTHANINNLRPRHPADLQLCTYTEFERVYEKALRAAGKDPEAIKAAHDAEIQKKLEEDKGESEGHGEGSGGFDFSNFLTSDLPPSSSSD